MAYFQRLSGVLLLSVSVVMAGFSGVAVSDAGKEGYRVEGQLSVFKKGGKKPLKGFDHAVVYLTREQPALVSPAPVAPLPIDQSKKTFVPRLLPVVKGQLVHFYNRDTVDHNVFSRDQPNEFDLGRYPKGSFQPQRFERLGLQKVYCNIHKAMILDVMVLPNRFFAKTNAEGQFSIDEVPAGRYQLHAWHIYGGEQQQMIEVAGDTRVPNFSLESLRVVRELNNHLNKDGKRYKKKPRYSR